MLRGGGRYKKLVVLLFTDLTKNVGGAKGCLLSKIIKVGGAIAPPAPPVPPPLIGALHSKILNGLIRVKKCINFQNFCCSDVLDLNNGKMLWPI